MRFTQFLVCAAVLLISGCSNPVQVADNTGAWDINTQYFYANLDVDEDYVVEEVWVNYSRHYWPEIEKAHRVEAELVVSGPNAGQWRAHVVDAPNFWKADSLFYVWNARYRKQGDNSFKTAESVVNNQEPHRRLVGCSDGSVQATMNAVFQVMNNLRQEGGQNIHPNYINSPAHLGPVSLEDQGVPYSHTPTVLAVGANTHNDHYDNIKLGEPQLLLYAPGSSSISAITDGESDEPYALIGAAYGAMHKNAKRRPRLGCIPSESWFIHEAGYHLANGGFHPTAPNESFPGEVPVGMHGGVNTPDLIPGNPPYQPDPAPEVVNPISSLPVVWHPRLWDVHFWFSSETESGVVMDIKFPDGQPGLETPEKTFFYSETFQ